MLVQSLQPMLQAMQAKGVQVVQAGSPVNPVMQLRQLDWVPEQVLQAG